MLFTHKKDEFLGYERITRLIIELVDSEWKDMK